MLLINGVEYATNVVITSPLPDGTNNIGDVDIASALPVGSNTIGAINVNSNAAKSSASFTRPADTTAYAAGDVVGGLLTFANVLGSVQNFIITGVTDRIDVAAIPAGMGGFKLHLFDAEPAAIADNAAFNIAAADRSKYLGYIQIATPSDLGDTLFSQNDNVNFNGKLATTTLYGYKTTDNAFTPTALTVKTTSIYTIGV